MKILRLILLFFVTLYCLPLLLPAQTITQDEFLNLLIKTHPLFEKEKLTAQIEKEEQNSYRGAEDWTFFSTANFSHLEPAIAYAGPEKMDAFSLDGGFERLFWKTGGRLSASFSSSLSYIKIDPVFGFPDHFYQNKFSITYTHPLLQNKKGFLDRLQHDLKQFDVDFSEVRAIENLENFLTASSRKFLNWVLLTEQREIVSERLSLSEEELARTERKLKAHLIDKVDMIRAEDAVRIAKQNQMLVESQWKALQAELAVLSQNNEIYNLSPEFNLYEVKDFIPLEEAVSQLRTESRLIHTLNIRLKQLEYSRKGYEEILKPQLSAKAQFNIKKAAEGLDRALGMDKPDVVVGLQYSFPLRNRTAKAQIIKTDLQIDQLKKQVDDLTLNLASVLTNLYIQIRELEKVMQLNQEQIESAKRKTEEELKLYNQGRGDLTFVIQSRDNEENAKLTYAVNALTYHKLITEYRDLMDQLYK